MYVYMYVKKAYRQVGIEKRKHYKYDMRHQAKLS